MMSACIAHSTVRRHRIAASLFAWFLLVVFAGFAHAAEVTLEWDPNTEADLAGYKIHCGTASGHYDHHIDVGNVTQYTVTGLAAGTYFFSATAYNTSGIESAYSNEITTEIGNVANTCTYQISPTSAQFGPAGGTGTAQVTAPEGCAWSATATAPMTITSGLSGSGNGTVSYSVPANTNANSLTMTATVAGMIFTVTQTSSAYTIIASAGTGGAISPAGTATVTYGARKTYTITPYSGYTVADVLVDGVSVGRVTSYTFSNITASHMIAATFAQATTSYTIITSAGTGGRITPSGTATVTSGTSKTFKISPKYGYIIADVLVDGVSVGAVTSYTFSNVKASHMIAATFSRTTVTQTTSTLPGRSY